MLTVDLLGILLAGLVTAIAWVDFRSLRIPDSLTLAVATLGIVFQTLYSAAGVGSHLMAGAAVFCTFWATRRGYARARGDVGLGFGDVKLASACAIWLEPLNLPLFVLLATVPALGYAAGLSLIAGKNVQRFRLPFGPFLGLALIMVWYGEQYLFF